MDQKVYICENCGKEFTEDWRKHKKGNPRFCCRNCSNSFSSKHIKYQELKEGKCTQCGAPIFVKKNASLKNILCDTCKNNKKQSNFKFDSTTEIGKFERSQLYTRKSPNLIKIGFNFNSDLNTEYYRIKNILYNLYWVEKESQLNIMKLFKIPSTGTVSNLFKSFNIPSRDASEAGILSLKEERRILPEYGTYFHHGYYINNQGIKCYLRSDLEFKLAEKLDELNIPFTTEQKITYLDSQLGHIRNGFPDFYIPELNLYIETKGDWLLDHINLEDRWKSIRNDHKNFIILDFKTNNKKHTLNNLIEYYYSSKDKSKIKNRLDFIWAI